MVIFIYTTPPLLRLIYLSIYLSIYLLPWAICQDIVMFDIYRSKKKSIDQEFSDLMRQFDVLHWEEDIPNVPRMLCIIAAPPPRKYRTDFAYYNLRLFLHIYIPWYSLDIIMVNTAAAIDTKKQCNVVLILCSRLYSRDPRGRCSSRYSGSGLRSLRLTI